VLVTLPHIHAPQGLRNEPGVFKMATDAKMNTLRQRIAWHEAGHAVAAITYGVPIISITVDGDMPHLHRGRYRAPSADLALESLCVLCMAGAAAEEFFTGPITDNAARDDYDMARSYLARYYDPVTVGAGLKQARDAADRLVRTPAVAERIKLIANALQQRGASAL
jgi:hypothetical protein